MMINTPENIILTLTNRLIRVPLGLVNYILRDCDMSLVNYTLRKLYVGHQILGLDRTGKRASKMEEIAFIASAQYDPQVVDQESVTNNIIAAWALTKWDIQNIGSFFVLPPPTQLMFCVGNLREDADSPGIAFECYDVTVFDSYGYKAIAGMFRRYRESYSRPSETDYSVEDALAQLHGKKNEIKPELMDDGIKHIAAIRGSLDSYPEDIRLFLREQGLTHIFYRADSKKPTWRNSVLEEL